MDVQSTSVKIIIYIHIKSIIRPFKIHKCPIMDVLWMSSPVANGYTMDVHCTSAVLNMDVQWMYTMSDMDVHCTYIRRTCAYWVISYNVRVRIYDVIPGGRLIIALDFSTIKRKIKR